MLDSMNKDVEKYLRLAKLAVTTKTLYRHYLDVFFSECNPEIDAVGLFDWLDSHTWSSSTRHSAICAVQGFYAWRFGNLHPVLEAKEKRVNPGPQRTLDKNKMETIMSQFDAYKPKGIRDLALFALMTDTGLRASEVCRLELKYFDMQARRLFVIIKGGDWGEGVFFDYTASCMSAWLGIRDRIAKPGTETVFVSTGGKRPGTSITKDGLRAIFRKYGLSSSIGLISPHDLRRTFATELTLNGAPTRLVQVAGRWKSISQVEHYTQALSAKDIEPFSPMNRVMEVN
ncbi:MAG: tyrosine-type recombinase/integrase [Anaerolineaceae bacterium]|nr:tyrosine-type recombinase/integrase [Anaerolineaceae bacterium]